MAQISNANLTAICDKMARHALEANGSPIASAIATGGAYTATVPNDGLLVANTDILGPLETLVTGFTDPDQQSDFVSPVSNLVLNTPLLNQFLYSYWSSVRRALNDHMARYSINAMIVGDRSPLDAALRVINLTTLLRLSGTFQTFYGDISPSHLFTPVPYVLANITITGATTLTFSHVKPITGVYGQGQLAILNTKAEGLSSTVLTLSAVAGGLTLTPTATVTVTTIEELTACSDTSQIYVDCVGATVTGGVATDTFAVVILPDRLINAA